MANSNSGTKFYVCATAQPSDLNATTFAALTWVEVKGVGSMGETGSKQNILNYDTWGGTVIDKAKGMTDAGSPVLECARIVTDAGQVILRAQAQVNAAYAFKLVKNDMPAGGTKATTIYQRGYVVGPVRPNGRNEDFDLEQYTLAMVQQEVIVDAV